MAAKIELVLFDMDNVLCHYDRWTRAARLAQISGGQENAIYRAIWDSGFERLGDSGALTSSEYLREFGDRIGYPLSLDEWLDARRTASGPDHDMLDIVRRLSGSVNVAILTNNTELVVEHIDFLCSELGPLFGQHIYASARFRAAKPHAACYRSCLAELGAKPEAVLFVDDLEENVTGARQAGLHAERFTSVDGFRATLQLYGL